MYIIGTEFSAYHSRAGKIEDTNIMVDFRSVLDEIVTLIERSPTGVLSIETVENLTIERCKVPDVRITFLHQEDVRFDFDLCQPKNALCSGHFCWLSVAVSDVIFHVIYIVKEKESFVMAAYIQYGKPVKLCSDGRSLRCMAFQPVQRCKKMAIVQMVQEMTYLNSLTDEKLDQLQFWLSTKSSSYHSQEIPYFRFKAIISDVTENTVVFRVWATT